MIQFGVVLAVLAMVLVVLLVKIGLELHSSRQKPVAAKPQQQDPAAIDSVPHLALSGAQPNLPTDGAKYRSLELIRAQSRSGFGARPAAALHYNSRDRTDQSVRAVNGSGFGKKREFGKRNKAPV